MEISIILPALMVLTGAFLLIKHKFFFILHPIKTVREFGSALKDGATRRSFFLALSGTLGVGNIFGVAAGIMIGGAGSLFWLFISSFFAMIIKYSETLLTFEKGAPTGGMSEVVKVIFKKWGRLLSPLYAFLTVLLSLFMGSAIQSAALLDVAESGLKFRPEFTLVILLILLSFCLVGGVKKIEKITEIVIPLTTIIYIIMCFGVIFINFSKLGSVIRLCVTSAFDFKSAVGGAISLASVREGFSRGILSNEAGVGTSAMAHCRSPERPPHTAGLFAMCEVVFDSTLLCTITGLAILLCVDNISDFSTPMALVSSAFYSALGSFAIPILFLCVLAFAYSTIICWYFYGTECVRIYFPQIKLFYPILFVAFIVFSRLLKSNFLLYSIDFLLLLMTLITLSAILKNKKSRK